MNFSQDLENYVVNEFAFLNVPFTPTSDIEKDLLKLFTLHRKIIFPRPRKVQVSEQLKFKVRHESRYLAEIMEIIRRLEEGVDINFLQSSKLFNFHVHDHLVYDWNIFHLHLSFEKGTDNYFRKRTKEVLFVYVSKDRAFLLDIAKHPPHDVFADKKLLEILESNWKEILSEVQGVVGLSHHLKTHERFRSRKHNLNEGILEVNGRYVASPGFGQTASGHSIEAVIQLNELQNWLSDNEEAILTDRDRVDAMFIKMYDLPVAPAYKLLFRDDGPQIWDINSNQCLLEYRKVIRVNTLGLEERLELGI